jgi:hypothetical protein
MKDITKKRMSSSVKQSEGGGDVFSAKKCKGVRRKLIEYEDKESG